MLAIARQILREGVSRRARRKTFVGPLHFVSHRPVACVIKLDRLTIRMSMNSGRLPGSNNVIFIRVELSLCGF